MARARSARSACSSTLFLDWFGLDAPPGLHVIGTLHTTGWASLGWLLDVLLCVVAFGGLSITYMTLRRTSPAWPVGAAVLTIVVGGITFLVAARAGADPARPRAPGCPTRWSASRLPAYLGLLFAALIPAGAWLALRDERARRARVGLHAARPVPARGPGRA